MSSEPTQALRCSQMMIIQTAWNGGRTGLRTLTQDQYGKGQARSRERERAWLFGPMGFCLSSAQMYLELLSPHLGCPPVYLTFTIVYIFLWILQPLPASHLSDSGSVCLSPGTAPVWGSSPWSQLSPGVGDSSLLWPFRPSGRCPLAC